jgi:hypothetical protein
MLPVKLAYVGFTIFGYEPNVLNFFTIFIITCNPSISFLDVHPQEEKATCHRDTCTLMFVVELVTLVKM